MVRWLINFLVEVRSRFLIDTSALREDTRKIAVSMIITSLVGAIIVTDKVSSRDAFVLGIVGIIFWVVSLLKKRDT